MKIELKVEGLSCGHCVNTVQKILSEMSGVELVKVSLPDNAEIVFDENIVSLADIKNEVSKTEMYKIV